MTNNKYNIKVRLNRSELAVPGSRIDFFEKAAKSHADIIFLDLEDSVSISQKSSALHVQSSIWLLLFWNILDKARFVAQR